MSEKKDLYKLGDPKDFLKRRATLSGLTSAEATSALANQKIKPASTVSSKLSNVIKKVAKKTVVGKVLDNAVKIGAGIGAGYEYAKSKFTNQDKKLKKEKTNVDKKSMGGEIVVTKGGDYIKDLID